MEAAQTNSVKVQLRSTRPTHESFVFENQIPRLEAKGCNKVSSLCLVNEKNCWKTVLLMLLPIILLMGSRTIENFFAIGAEL
jgi:hypothetical protein